MKALGIILDGIVKRNPTFVLILGMCPTLGTTSSAMTGMSMGLATLFVLICSNVAISLIKNIVPDKVRIPVFIVVIASFVTMLQMVMQAYLPSLYATLGIFIPLIVVNCILLGRAEAFASKNGVLLSLCDGVGVGIGFTIALTILGAVREILGTGAVFGYQLYSADFGALIFVLAPGAFIVLGLLIACSTVCTPAKVMLEYLSIIFSAILVNNIVFAQFLGICPFIGVSKNLESAFGMSMAVTFVMAVATAVTWLLQHYVLLPLGLVYIQTIAFILVIAVLVQMLEIIMKKISPALYAALGVFLPLITTNCAVLGVAIIVAQKDFGLMHSVVYAVATAIGFGLALTLFAAIRTQLALSDVPRSMRGVPIALIVAGILAMAFMGFTGIKIA